MRRVNAECKQPQATAVIHVIIAIGLHRIWRRLAETQV